MGQGEHAPPLAEDDDLSSLLEHELPNKLAQFQQLGRGQALEHVSSGGTLANRRPHPLEIELSQPVGDDPLGRQQLHELEKLGLGQRPLERPLHELRDRLVEIFVLVHLLLGHLDRHAGVGSRRKLIEHVLPNPPHHAMPQPVADRVEIPGTDDLAAAIGPRRVQRSEPPLGLERHVVDPFDNRRQLVDPVLHRRAGQDQTIAGRQPLDRERRLGRPVLDPLRLVEHDQFRVPALDDLEVAEQLFIIDDQEPFLAFGVGGLAFLGRAVDDLDRQVGKHLPFAGPLRLEAGRRDDQAAANAAGPLEDVAAGDRLGGLSQPHIVGQQQAASRQESLDPLALIGVKRALHALERLAHLRSAQASFHERFQVLALALEQRSQRRVVRDPVGTGGRHDLEQVFDQFEPPGRLVPVACFSRWRRHPCSSETT